MEGEPKNWMIFSSAVIASLSYCYFLSSKIPKGKLRFISLLPILSLFTLLPLSLSYAFNIAVATFFITWLSNFKLFLFAFDRGPLSSKPDPPKSLLHFITIAALPIKIQPQTRDHTQNKKISAAAKPKTLPLNLPLEVLILSILVGVLCNYKEKLHEKIVLVLYCFVMFLLINILIATSNTVIRAVVGGELEAASNEPYLSSSLQEFWGQRWNLMVTNALRHTIYIPVRSALSGKTTWAPAAAMLASFLVSGLMHELLFYYATRMAPTWEMTSFFVLHGVCVAVEVHVKKALAGKKWRLPLYVARPLTVGFVVATGFWLFFPPLLKSGGDVKVLNEFKIFVGFVKRNLNLDYIVSQRWI